MADGDVLKIVNGHQAFGAPSGGGGVTFHGWVLTYDTDNGGNQVMAADGSTINPAWNVESTDTDGFHTGSNAYITIPVGLGGWYDLRLLTITGNGGAVTDDLGTRHAYFVRNVPTYDPVPGFAQADLLDRKDNVQFLISVFAQLNEGDTVATEFYSSGYDADVKIAFDAVYLQDTVFMGRYIGPA